MQLVPEDLSPRNQRNQAPPIANSYWVASDLLLAGPYLGDLDPDAVEVKINALAAAGIRVVLNLQSTNELGRHGTRFPDLTARMAGLGIKCIRFPIVDMDIPPNDEMTDILDVIDNENASGNAVYVHCWGGHGRTGTVVGCWMKRHGIAGPQGPLTRRLALRGAAGIHAASPQTAQQRQTIDGLAFTGFYAVD